MGLAREMTDILTLGTTILALSSRPSVGFGACRASGHPGGWSGLDLAIGGRAFSARCADRRSVPCTRASLENGERRLRLGNLVGGRVGKSRWRSAW